MDFLASPLLGLRIFINSGDISTHMSSYRTSFMCLQKPFFLFTCQMLFELFKHIFFQLVSIVYFNLWLLKYWMQNRIEETLCGNKMRNWNLYITVSLHLVLNMNFAFNPPIKPSLSLMCNMNTRAIVPQFTKLFLCFYVSSMQPIVNCIDFNRVALIWLNLWSLVNVMLINDLLKSEDLTLRVFSSAETTSVCKYTCQNLENNSWPRGNVKVFMHLFKLLGLSWN